MKKERTLGEATRTLDAKKANKAKDATPSRSDGRDGDLAFDGTQLRIKYLGFWYHFDSVANNWIKEI